MSVECNKTLNFYPYKGEKIPDDFSFNKEDQPLVDFFNRSAEKCVDNLVSKVFILKDDQDRFIGYVSLGFKAIVRETLATSKRGGLFNRPALIIGYLLIDKRYRGNEYGMIVLDFVVAIVLLMKCYLPIRLLVIEALHDRSKKYFEEHWKFEALPDDPYTLVFDLLQILKK